MGEFVYGKILMVVQCVNFHLLCVQLISDLFAFYHPVIRLYKLLESALKEKQKCDLILSCTSGA